MPPRLPVRLARHLTAPPSSSAIPIFLLPFLTRYASSSSSSNILAELSDTPSSYKKKIRRGRGPSSGKGKTSGRGHKGQKQHGKVPVGFQGGQTSDDIVHGKEGFKNLHAIEMAPVNLDTIQTWIDAGRLDPSKPITLREIRGSNAIHGVKDGVKLLSRGKEIFKTPINIVVSRASQSAIAAVEALGGSVTTRFYTAPAIRRILARKSDPFVSLKWDQDAMAIGPSSPVYRGSAASDPRQRARGMGFEYRLPDPTSRKEIEYYRDPKNRGYLSYTLKEGEEPSLYFGTRLLEARKMASGLTPQKSQEKARKEENRLW